jgi:hypothetical protein
MMSMNRCSVITAFASCCASLAFSVKAAESPSDLATITARVAQAEHHLNNLEIRGFSLLIDVRTSEDLPWRRERQTSEGDAWYNGLRASKVRVNMREVQPWDNPATPMLETQSDIGWDGTVGHTVNVRFGAPGHPADWSYALISNSVPPRIEAGHMQQAYADGTAFTLNYYRDESFDGPLSAVFERVIAKKASMAISWDTIYGAKTIRVADGDGVLSRAAWWLDPDRDYAIRRVEEWSKADPAGPRQSLANVEVPEMVEAGPGVWFPIRATREEAYHLGFRKFTFQAKRIVANNPNFDEKIFTVPIPPRYMVRDETTGKTFYTVDPKATTQSVDQAVKALHDQQ